MLGTLKEASDFIGGKNPIDAILLLVAYGIIVYVLGNILIKGFNYFYTKKRGEEKRDESTDQKIKDLQDQINILEKDHTKDNEELKTLISDLKQELRTTSGKLEKEINRATNADLSIMRSDIIRIYKECKRDGGRISPVDKENLDKLFKNYFANNNDDYDGIIADIKKDYDETFTVDHLKL